MWYIVTAAVSLVVGVLGATPIKDFLKGVPAEARAEADKLIAEAVAAVKARL